MAAVALEQEVQDSQVGYPGADFDRGVARLVDRTIAELAADRSLDGLDDLLGVVSIIKHRPELVGRLGRETDGRLAQHRQRSRERYARQKAKRDAERAKPRSVAGREDARRPCGRSAGSSLSASGVVR
jgi:hypothetical protein